MKGAFKLGANPAHRRACGKSRCSSVVVRCSSERIPWLPKVSASILAGVLLTQVAGAADAASSVSITQRQLDEAKEMLEIVQSRTGRPLQSLQSSPNLPSAPVLKAESVKDVDTAALLAQIESLTKTLNEQKLSAAASAEDARRLRFEKEQLEKNSAPQTSASEPLVTPRSAPAPAATTAPAPSAAEEERKKDSGGPAGLLNVMGIFLGGGAVGYVALQKREIENVSVEAETKLGSERKTIEQLQKQANDVKAALEKQEQLSSSLRSELNKAKEDNIKLREAEIMEKQKSKEALDLSARALKAEEAKVAAVKREIAASEELTMSERTAKFAAEAEAKALQAKLKEAAIQLEKGVKTGEELSKALEQTEAKVNTVGAANEELKEKLARAEAALAQEKEEAAQKMKAAEAALAKEKADATSKLQAAEIALNKEKAEGSANLSAAEAALAKEKADAAARLSAAEATLAKEKADAADRLAAAEAALAKEMEALSASKAALAQEKAETSKVKTEMSSMRERADAIAREAQKAAQAAAAERAAADAELTRVTDALKAAQKEASDARKTIDELEKSRSQATSRVTSLEAELATQKNANATLASQLSALQKQAQETDAALTEMVDAKKEALELRSQLQVLNQQLGKSSDELMAERSKRENVEKAIAALKAEYEKAGADLENERAISKALKAEAEALKKQVSEAEATSKAMKEQLVDMNLSFNQKLAKAEQDAAAAGDQARTVESELVAVRTELASAMAASKDSQAGLEAEKEAREAAENNLAQLRLQLDTMLANNEEAKAAAEQQLAMLKTQFVELQKRMVDRKASGARAKKPAPKLEDGTEAPASSAQPTTTKKVASKAARSSDNKVIEASKLADAPAAPKKATKRASRKAVVAKAAAPAAPSASNDSLEAPAPDAPPAKTKATRAKKAAEEASLGAPSASCNSPEAAAPEAAPAKKRATRSKKTAAAASAGEPLPPQSPGEDPLAPPKAKTVKAASRSARPRAERVVAASLSALGASAAAIDSEALPASPAVRGRGRPRKVQPAEGSEALPASNPAKRGPGRPRKVVSAEAAAPGAVPPAKRGPGRPRKVVSAEAAAPGAIPPAKGGPGRPRQNPPAST